MKDLHLAAIPFLMGQDPDGTPLFYELTDDTVIYSNYGHHITAGHFRALAAAMSMVAPNAAIVVGALDSLAISLAARGHAWDEGERAIFEQAIELMGGVPPEFTDGNPPDDPADHWKKG